MCVTNTTFYIYISLFNIRKDKIEIVKFKSELFQKATQSKLAKL